MSRSEFLCDRWISKVDSMKLNNSFAMSVAEYNFFNGNYICIRCEYPGAMHKCITLETEDSCKIYLLEAVQQILVRPPKLIKSHRLILHELHDR